MSSLLDTIRSQLGQNEIAQISQHLGVDPATAQQAIDTALPAVVAGMAQHASTPDGAQQVQQAAGEHGGLMGNIASAMQGGGGLGGGLLGAILGRHADTVQTTTQQSSGLDSAQTRQLLAMLAPVVLAALARHHAQSASTPGAAAGGGGLSSILQQAAAQASAASPELGGMLGKIFGN